MNAKPIRLVRKPADNSRQKDAMAEIEKSWAKWTGPSGKQWKPYNGATTPWSSKVSASLDKGRYKVKVSEPIPLWRRILRKIRVMK